MAAAPPPDALRCQRNGGRGWRCSEVKRDGHPYCERHYQARRQRSLSTEGDASTGNHRRSKKFRSLSDWSDDVETHKDMGFDDYSEAEPARRIHNMPSPTCPPKHYIQLSTSRPQTAPDTISAIPFIPDGTQMIQANSILNCPAGVAGKFCLPQDVELEKVDLDALISTGNIFLARAMDMFEIGAKRLCETQKCASSVGQLKEENERLKTLVEGLKNQCADLKTKTESDASEVQQLKAQLNAQRARRLHDQLNFKGLKEENEQLKAEMEGLKKQCFELKSKTESDASEILRLEYQLISERVKVVRELGVTRTGISPVATISSLSMEKDELSRLFEQSRNEMETQSSTIRELQSFIELLEGKVASSMEREATLRVSIMLAGRSADADVKQARQAGYNDGLIEGRRMAWGEFVKLPQPEHSKPQRPIQGCAVNQDGSSFHPL